MFPQLRFFSENCGLSWVEGVTVNAARNSNKKPLIRSPRTGGRFKIRFMEEDSILKSC